MKITTVSTTNKGEFDKEVNQLLKEGWELHGGPAVTSITHRGRWDGEERTSLIIAYVQILKIDDRLLK